MDKLGTNQACFTQYWIKFSCLSNRKIHTKGFANLYKHVVEGYRKIVTDVENCQFLLQEKHGGRKGVSPTASAVFDGFTSRRPLKQ